ncbi:antiterminator Q family protein, partial [Enterobacter roggenkampii]
HGDVLMWLMKTLLTSGCTNQRGAGHIEGCLARLQKRKPYEHSLLVAHYLYGISKRKIAKARKKDEKLIRIEIQMAEGFIDGCLSMLDVSLEMDVEVKS